MVKPKQVLIAIDQLINALIGGYADETISARAWRKRDVSWLWSTSRRVIDAVFFMTKNHCYKAWQAEFTRHQLPPAYRLLTPN